MPISVAPSLPPVAAVNQTCRVCGSAVYCGTPLCPSSALPVGYDAVPQVSTAYVSVTTKYVATYDQSPNTPTSPLHVPGVSAGFYGRGS